MIKLPAYNALGQPDEVATPQREYSRLGITDGSKSRPRHGYEIVNRKIINRKPDSTEPDLINFRIPGSFLWNPRFHVTPKLHQHHRIDRADRSGKL
jgi:hypothetical protein